MRWVLYLIPVYASYPWHTSHFPYWGRAFERDSFNFFRGVYYDNLLIRQKRDESCHRPILKRKAVTLTKLSWILARMQNLVKSAMMMMLKMKKIVPLSACEIPFCQNVCKLMFGINVSNLNFRIKINPVKQPIQSNSVGSWHVSHCGTLAFDYHLNHGFIVLKNLFK